MPLVVCLFVQGLPVIPYWLCNSSQSIQHSSLDGGSESLYRKPWKSWNLILFPVPEYYHFLYQCGNRNRSLWRIVNYEARYSRFFLDEVCIVGRLGIFHKNLHSRYGSTHEGHLLHYGHVQDPSCRIPLTLCFRNLLKNDLFNIFFCTPNNQIRGKTPVFKAARKPRVDKSSFIAD